VKTRLAKFPFWHEAVLALLLVALLITANTMEPRFMRLGTQIELSRHLWEIALLALPMMLIIITAGIDLSVGSNMAMCAVTLGLLYEAHVPMPLAIGAALLVGIIGGAINGAFIAFLRVHPLIVTLATLSAFRGVAEGVSLARPISGFPASFGLLAQGTFACLPIPAWMFIAAAIVCSVILAKTPFGRFLYAIGYNENACRFTGINVPRIKLLLYTLAGFMSALSAIIFVARRNTAKADVGTGIELDVIAAVVLGGVSIFGGRGNIVGMLLGVVLIHETREFVSWHWNNDELILVVLGVLLIASVLLNSLFSRRSRSD
jgi:rhamnose transport system permease protein